MPLWSWPGVTTEAGCRTLRRKNRPAGARGPAPAGLFLLFSLPKGMGRPAAREAGTSSSRWLEEPRKRRGDVPESLHKFPVHQHVHQGEQRAGGPAAGAALPGQLLPGVAGKGPHGLVRELLPQAVEEGEQGALVVRLEGLAPSRGKPADVGTVQGLQKRLPRSRR